MKFSSILIFFTPAVSVLSSWRYIQLLPGFASLACLIRKIILLCGYQYPGMGRHAKIFSFYGY